ncbi:late embryogenesis abundant protein At5g17165-like [Impatiens glandulifera]|uniref:late embryogenesis abundant protein At5g17165-like n=1 Tax=Impatiens glandulifera TaxID=253017 RepID=UPI001FB0BD6B|nr:late embryogenesis abundant protein At5g17165-like [Impatiens glandulifera]
MAANSKTRALVGFGKRFVGQIEGGKLVDTARSASLASSRRAVHGSVYDKNVDDHVRPSVVPDNVIKSESEKYWGPDPQTGVFGPSSEKWPSNGGRKATTENIEGKEDSVLEQKTFFRPQEDLEKPIQA